MSTYSGTDDWQVQVLWDIGVWCGMVWGSWRMVCVLEAVRGVVGEAGWDQTSQAAMQLLL